MHVAQTELEAAQSGESFRFRARYRPFHLEKDTKWKTFDLRGGERWYGFESVKEINSLPPEILLVQLPGHTPGHFGVAVTNGSEWLLHAGDAYYDHRELINKSDASLGLRFFQRIAHTNYTEAMHTQVRLAEIRSQISILCSHDPSELPQP